MKHTIQPATEAESAAYIYYLLEERVYDAADRFLIAFDKAVAFIRKYPTTCPPFAAFRSWPLPGFSKVRVQRIATLSPSEPTDHRHHLESGLFGKSATLRQSQQ